jgi:hypothetical protein
MTLDRRGTSPENTMRDIPTETTAPTLAIGTRIHVRSRYLGEWCDGFVVAEILDNGCRIRRTSDGHDFPDVFPFDDVRLERRRDPLRRVSRTTTDTVSWRRSVRR